MFWRFAMRLLFVLLGLMMVCGLVADADDRGMKVLYREKCVAFVWCCQNRYLSCVGWMSISSEII